MEIDVLGTGSAYSIKRNTSSILVSDASKKHWLIDCGATVPRALWQRALPLDAIEAIWITHIHPDHCLGLTTLLNNWHSRGRRAPLQIWCQPDHQPELEKLVGLAYWPEAGLNYALSWHRCEDAMQWQNWRLSSAFSQHEISNRALRIEVDGQVLFYSGDGRPTPDTIALMQGADWVFQECASAASLPSDSSHGDLPDALALRQKADFGQLYLYHCNDAFCDEVEQRLATEPGVALAYDGMVVGR